MELRDKNGLTEKEFLASYSPKNYPRPSVAADMVIFAREGEKVKVLLVRRGGHPCLGQWALPGGFVSPGETVGHAAARELLEETGVSGAVPKQLFTYSQPDRDPRSWTMSAAHMAVVEASELKVQAGDDAADAGWFAVSCRQEGDLYFLTLQKDDEILTAKVQHTDDYDDGPYRIMENNGLAFDHAKILAFALQRLQEE